jgi:hypothetical protein
MNFQPAKNKNGYILCICILAFTLYGCNRTGISLPKHPPIVVQSYPQSVVNPSQMSGQTSVSQSADIDNYFPHQPGSYWLMNGLMDSQKYNIKRVVISVGPTIKSGFGFVWYRNGKPVQVEKYNADASGVYCIATGAGAACLYNPPIPVLQFPVKNGNVWNWKGSFQTPNGSLQAESISRLTGPISLKTADSTYNEVYEIKTNFVVHKKDGPSAITSIQWYKPGVGMIRQVVDDTTSLETVSVSQYKPVKQSQIDHTHPPLLSGNVKTK